MSTYLNGQANGALVFDTLDYLVTQHIIPTIEIGFMPELLASDPTATVFHYKGGTSPPASWQQWSAFITQFTRLLVTRYGSELVRTWRFEVWNEPNCGFYDVINCCGPTCGNQTAYFQLYAATAHAIKAVDAQLQVGGPATAQLSWIPEFLAATRAASAPVDFVSSHLYPTDITQTREAFMDAIANATALARAAGLPFLLTEFNAGLGAPAGPSVPLLDSSYAASFLLHGHLRAQSIAGLLSMSYWTFTDFGFEEGGVDPLPWNPGASKFGIQTMYGVKKPAYRALQFVSDWRASTSVPVKASTGNQYYTSINGEVVGAAAGTVDAMVAVSDGLVTVLLGNYDVASATTPVPAAVNVTVRLLGLGDTLPANATLELIDDTHVNPYSTWLAAGSPVYPTMDEIEAEMASAAVLPSVLEIHASGSGGVQMTVLLQPYAVARVRLVVPSLRQNREQYVKGVRHSTRT